jgi:ATP-dependent exoDNAse (exonuclease V) beta subunit
MRRGVRNTLFRASVVATSGFVAGAAVEHKYPFYERLEGRLRNGREWIDPYMNKSDSVVVPVIEDAKEEIRETVQAVEAPEAIESPPGVLAPQLEYLSDQLFETTDNMLVFMFPSEELYLKQKSRVSEISEKISKFIIQVRKFFNQATKVADFKSTLKDFYTKALENVPKQYELLKLYLGYIKTLSEKRLYDFEDMLLMVINAFTKHPDLLATYQEKFQYLLVDEYQDTNGSQNKILELLSSFYQDQANIFVVGDDDQSIYKFQ